MLLQTGNALNPGGRRRGRDAESARRGESQEKGTQIHLRPLYPRARGTTSSKKGFGRHLREISIAKQAALWYNSPPEFNMKQLFLIICAACLALVSCQQQQQVGAGARTPKYVYRPGYTATVQSNGKATIPAKAPKRVKRIIAAGNKIVGLPYRRGGGHGKHYDSAYDCSGSVAFVLREAGMLKRGSHPVSGSFFRWGRKGAGDWVTVYVKNGHVFLTVAGLRFDTTGSGRGVGPRWYTASRPCSGFYVRHVPGY